MPPVATDPDPAGAVPDPGSGYPYRVKIRGHAEENLSRLDDDELIRGATEIGLIALLRVKGTDAAAVGDAQFEAWPHSDIGRLQNLAMVGLAALDDGAGSAS